MLNIYKYGTVEVKLVYPIHVTNGFLADQVTSTCWFKYLMNAPIVLLEMFLYHQYQGME